MMETKKTPALKPDFEKKFAVFVGSVGIFISIFLSPPLFKKIFTVSSLVLNENSLLWSWSVLLLIISVIITLFAKKTKPSFSFLFFIFFFFILLELLTRLYVVAFFEDSEKLELGQFSNKTYEEFSQYKGHPFLVYTGNPGVSYEENGEIKKTTVFNSMGFVGDDFNYNKQKNTIRIACIGGSTTERGYPAVTEYQLNKFFKDSLKFEVLNFGVSGWTSANSLVNYILNVRSFNPDYVLIHHGWNEERIRNTPRNLFQTDYSHALTYFHEPEIIDKIPIRISVLYRMLKNQFSYTSDWMFLGDATTIKNRKKTAITYDDVDELNTFRRNIKTIIQSCLNDGSKVLLSTQPFSLSKEDETSKTIEQANNIIRSLHLAYNKKVLFLDLDSTTTGNLNEVFIDLAHMNNMGNYYKGTEFARVIINEIANDSIKTTSPYKIKNPIVYQNYTTTILSNKKDKERLNGKTLADKVSLYSAIKKDALNHFHKTNENKPQNRMFDYSFQEYKIVTNKEWYEQIKVQAKERKISVAENLKKNINYMLDK